jgi:hypothetical protein
LRIQIDTPGIIRWTHDGWKNFHEISSDDIGLGLNTAELPTASFSAGSKIEFTWRDTAGNWRGFNFTVEIY